MKLLASHNILDGAAYLRVPSGQYKGFFLRIAATAQAAQDLTAAECGLITVLSKGQSIMSITLEDLQDINNVIGGVIEEDVNVGGACEFTCFIPAALAADPNIFDVGDNEMFIQVDLSGVSATNVASGTLTLYGVVSQGVQVYEPMVSYQTPNIPASGTYVLTIPLENTTHIFISDVTNASRIAVMVDGESVIDGAVTDLLNISNAIWRVETALTTFLGLVVQPNSALGASLSDDVRIQLTAGSGGAWTPNVIAWGINPSPDKLARSRATSEAQTRKVLTRKARFGKNNAVTVARMVRADLNTT